VDAGQVQSVTLDGERIVFRAKNDGNTYVAIKPQGEMLTGNLTRELIEKGVTSRPNRRRSRASCRSCRCGCPSSS
jgi:hypothetical protein